MTLVVQKLRTRQGKLGAPPISVGFTLLNHSFSIEDFHYYWLHVGPFLFVIVLSLRGLVVASDYPFSIFKHLLIF